MLEFFQDVKEGQPISASDFNRVRRVLNALSSLLGPGGAQGCFVDGMAGFARQRKLFRKVVEITSRSNNAHAWKEKTPDASGAWIDAVNGLTGSTTVNPLYGTSKQHYLAGTLVEAMLGHPNTSTPLQEYVSPQDTVIACRLTGHGTQTISAASSLYLQWDADFDYGRGTDGYFTTSDRERITPDTLDAGVSLLWWSITLDHATVLGADGGTQVVLELDDSGTPLAVDAKPSADNDGASPDIYQYITYTGLVVRNVEAADYFRFNVINNDNQADWNVARAECGVILLNAGSR